MLINDLDVSIDRSDNHLCLLAGLSYAKRLAKAAGATFRIDDDNNVIIDVDGVRSRITTSEELFILHEVYVAGIYNISASTPLLFLDVGMNVGISALFFAKKFADAVIVGYEPVGSTYRSALENYALNPALSQRIVAHNFGLGAEKRTINITYPSKNKGSASELGISSEVANEDLISEEITILNASDQVEALVRSYPDREIVAKIDCEGAEFEIIRELDERQMLSLFSVLMIEWHRELAKADPDDLVKRLQKNGFTTFVFQPHDSIGMIYGHRRS